jgi:hypothetical protein
VDFILRIFGSLLENEFLAVKNCQSFESSELFRQNFECFIQMSFTPKILEKNGEVYISQAMK